MNDECKKVIRLSPVAWQHISLVGKYEFATNVKLPDLDSIISKMINGLSQVAITNSNKAYKKQAKSK